MPQGTLFGASSESGTLRIITNKPTTAGFSAGYDLQGDSISHGSQGYVAEGFVNAPVNELVAVRLVGFEEHDAGFIDNVPATRTFQEGYPNGPIDGTLKNAAFVKRHANPVDTFGGRAALKIDLDENWTVTPTFLGQDQRYSGVFGYEPSVGDLQTQRFGPDRFHDRFYRAGLTINGKIGRYDLVYAGGYFQRTIDSKVDAFDLYDWRALAQAAVIYQSKNEVGLRTADIADLGSMPDYATADFSFGVEKNKLSFEVFLKNAFDSRGQENRYTPCTVQVCAATIPGIPKALYVAPIQPMTVSIKLAQRF